MFEMKKNLNNVKKLLSFLLILTLVFTMFPMNIAKAYASETKTNGFIDEVFLYEYYNNKGPGVKDYTFDKGIKEYDIVFPDSKPLNSNIRVTVPHEKVNNCYFAVLINGEEQKVQSRETNKTQNIHRIENDTNHYGWFQLFNTSNFPIGEKRDFSIRVGEYDEENQKWGVYDEYTYHVTRSLTLKKNVGSFTNYGFLVMANGNNASPEYDPTEDAYLNDYTSIIGDAKEISLTLRPTTKNCKIFVGSGSNRMEVEAGVETKVDLANYFIGDTKKAEIPITLEFDGKDGNLTRTYTLHTDPSSYPPIIKKDPQDTTVDKGENVPLTVEAELPEGSDGKLSYQWYENGNKINGATSASFVPPSLYAGSKKYYCKVTNTVGKVEFSTTSKTATYTVNLNKLTAPEFVKPLVIEGNNGSQFYVQNQKPVFSCFLAAGRYGEPIEGADYEFKLYRNKENTTDISKSELVKATVATAPVQSSGQKYNAYVEESQDIVGTYYYFLVVTAKKDKLEPDSRTSNTVKTVFKASKDVVKNLEGSGSEKDPYLIKDMNDLKYVRDLVNGLNGNKPFSFEGQNLKLTGTHYNLGKDWVPIGTLKEGATDPGNGKNILPFSGTLDANGATVSVDYRDGRTLFGYLRRATVKNMSIFGMKIKGYGLVENYVVDYGEDGIYSNDPIKNRIVDIENVKIKGGSKVLKSGFIGGYASGVNVVNIRNCVIEKGVTIGDDGKTWGDLGDTGYGYGFVSDWFNHQDNIGSFGGAFNGTVTNSVSYATVYGRKNVGGLIGMKGQSMGPCDIINSSFQGKIVATGDKVGGLVGAGYISGSATGTPTVEIHNSFVAADIEGNDKVGGLIGSEEGHVNFNDTGDSYGVKGALSVSDNHFYGNLTANGDHVGGIIGYVHDFTKKNGDATNYYLDKEGKIPAIGGAVAGEMTGLEKYAAPVNAEGFADGTVLNKLNSSETSNQNWEQKEKYPVISDKAVVTGLSIEGEYKTDYVLGEDLDLTGLKLYANFSDGSKKELDIEKDGVTVSGFDKNKRGQQKITLQYKAFKAEFGVKVLKKVDPNNPAKITVTFTLLGDKVHGALNEGDTSHTLTDNNLETWIKEESVTVPENSTVWDVIKAVDEKNEDVKFNNKGNYIDYIEYKGVKLAEFTNGENSGWMYTLNDKHPLLGIEEQYLDDGDNIVFHYTDDYTKEEGTDEWGPKPDPGEGENPGENPGNKPGGENPPTDKPGGGDTPTDKPSDKPAAKPDAGDKPAAAEKPATPKTGDENNVVLLGMLLLASVGTTAGLARRKRNG